MTEIAGTNVTLRPVTAADGADLRRIFATPEVAARWPEDCDTPGWPVPSDDAERRYAIVVDGRVVGLIQSWEERDPDYRHAAIDVCLDPAVHGRGLGTDAVRTLARYLVATGGHHRVTIDPAADNAVAIRCYTKVGFRPVGILRQYERDPRTGRWHDGLLMDLLAEDLTPSDLPSATTPT